MGETLGREKSGGSRGGWENHQNAIDPMLGRGKKDGRQDRKTLRLQCNVNKVSTKPMAGPRSQVRIREAGYLQGTGCFRVSAALSHWLRWAGGKQSGASSVDPRETLQLLPWAVTVLTVRDLGGAFPRPPHPTPRAARLFRGCCEPLFLSGNFKEGGYWNKLQLPSPLLHLISGP